MSENGRGRRLRTVLGAVVVVGALVYLLGSGLDRNLVYFLTPTELLARGDAAHDEPIRLSGTVVPGSVQWHAETLDLRFRVSDDANEIPVRSTGTPPEMFHDGIDVVVEGSLGSDGLFRARTLMVKHSNEYGPGTAEHPSERFPELPVGEGGTS